MPTAKFMSLLVTAGIALLPSSPSRAQSPGLVCIYPADCAASVKSDTARQYLIVKLVDQKGDPMPGAKVSYTLLKGGGTIVTREVTTDTNGLAPTVWVPAAGGFPAEFEVNASVGNGIVRRSINLRSSRGSDLVLRVPRKAMGNDQWWYENRQLRDSLTVVIEGATTQEECRRAAVAFRPVGGGVSAPDTVLGRWDPEGEWNCVATSWWRLPQGVGNHYLRASLSGEPTKSVTFKANARALPRIGVGLAAYRRHSFAERAGTDTLTVTRKLPDGNTTVVYDSIVSEVRERDAELAFTPTIGFDFPFFRRVAGLRASVATSLTDPTDHAFVGFSIPQLKYGTGQEALGVDLHLGLHVHRQEQLRDPSACRIDSSGCDTEKLTRYGIGLVGMVDGVSLLGNLLAIFGS